MNGFFLNKKFYTVPSSFNELSRRQLIELSAILHSSLPTNEARLRMLITLMNLSALPFFERHLIRFRIYFQISDEQLNDLLLLTDWITTSEEPLTKNLLPHVRIGLNRFYGSADGLSNITFIEFIKCETAYIKYVKTQDIEALNQLVAILYRPQRKRYNPDSPDYGGDRREKYNDALLETRTKRLAKLPHSVKLAIFMVYDGCRTAIIQRYPAIFKKDPYRTSEGRSKGWADVLRSLAGSVHKYEETAFQPIDIILFDLEGTILDNKELEAKLSK